MFFCQHSCRADEIPVVPSVKIRIGRTKCQLLPLSLLVLGGRNTSCHLCQNSYRADKVPVSPSVITRFGWTKHQLLPLPLLVLGGQNTSCSIFPVSLFPVTYPLYSCHPEPLLRRILTIPRAQFLGHSDTVWMASSHHGCLKITPQRLPPLFRRGQGGETV